MLTESAFFRRWAGAGLIVLSAGTLALAVDGRRDQEDAVQCQSRYNVAFAQAVRERGDLAAIQGEAAAALLSGLGRIIAIDTTTEEQVAEARRRYRELFADYAATTQRVDARRAGTPLPVLPEGCSDVN